MGRVGNSRKQVTVEYVPASIEEGRDRIRVRQIFVLRGVENLGWLSSYSQSLVVMQGGGSSPGG